MLNENVGDKLHTRMLLVVLGCLTDRAFHILTVYVNSLDPGWGTPSFVSGQLVCLQRFVRAAFETFVFTPVSAHCLTPYFHRM